MVSVIEKTDSLPLWLEHKKPVWPCDIKEEIDNSKEELNDYIPEPFLEHEFEPLNWNDTLANMMYVLTFMPQDIVKKKDMTSYPSIWSKSSWKIKKWKKVAIKVVN